MVLIFNAAIFAMLVICKKNNFRPCVFYSDVQRRGGKLSTKWISKEKFEPSQQTERSHGLF